MNKMHMNMCLCMYMLMYLFMYMYIDRNMGMSIIYRCMETCLFMHVECMAS